MNARTREHQPSPPGSRRRGRLPTGPSGRLPVCEGCADADVELSCECCGQEQCRSCWSDGDGTLCGACRGRAWDDVPPEDSVSPAGLLLGDDEEQWAAAR
ncbi:MAG: hypothetical protein LC799_20020 [Actinobacteria bacterium]|nr:hypothetical protein [Actinomycetota bacterium]